jgi:hypothetical protein
MFFIVAWIRLRAQDAANIALNQGDAGALNGNVGSRAYRNTDVGLRQGRRVVDHVAGHGVRRNV